MGIEIFRQENWSRWASGSFVLSDLRLSREKDRLLIQFIYATGGDRIRAHIRVCTGSPKSQRCP